MDILNWLYLNKNGLVRTTVANKDTNLIALGGDATFAKRGDKYLTYGMTVQDFKADLLYNPTNQFFVDPNREDTYVANGSIVTPFKTVAEAQAAIDALITAGTILPAEDNPIFIRIQGSLTENISLTKGHIFLVGENGSIHAPIYVFGTITVNGADTTTSALDNNHFSIQGLTIAPGGSNNGIVFTGANAQRLSLENMWVQVGGTGTGILCNNTGVRLSDGAKSRCHGSQIKVSHNGTGDVYCFNIVKGTADFTLVETSGATQVAAVQAGATLAFSQSELDANGETCLEVYGNGTLAVTQSTISNNFGATECYGVWLHDAGGVASVGQCLFQVSATNANSRAVHGVLGSALYYAYNAFFPGTTDTIDAVMGAGIVPIDTAFTAV